VAQLRLTLFGGFLACLSSGGAMTLPTRKAQALLAYLAIRPGHPHPRDQLAPLLWGDTPEPQARDSLRQAMAALRKALPGGSGSILKTEGQAVVLVPESVDVDVVTFERRMAEATPSALEEGVALYRGELLEGLAISAPAFEDWLRAERERLRELALEGLARLLGHHQKTPAVDPAIRIAFRLLDIDPLQEPVHRALMRLYTQSGRRAAALRQYQLCAGVLARELRVEPEPATKTLYQDILRQRRSASADVGGTPSIRQVPEPWAAQAPESSSPLIGRQAEMTHLVALLDAAHQGHGAMAVVVGETGIGKTRLIMELATEASRRGDRVLLARAYESEQILPFEPWVNALRESDSISEAALLPPVWRAELGRLFPEVADGALPSPSDDARRLFESVSRLIALLVAQRTMLLVLEDAHWADEMTLRLLAFLARRLRGWRALIVVTAREEELVDAPRLRATFAELKREGDLGWLALSALSREDTLALVRTLARVDDEEAELARRSAQIWALSEGNPFVITEAVQALHERERSEPFVIVPDRVREVIAERLERLDHRGREIVAVATVIGRAFEFPLVHLAAGLEERDAGIAMEELIRRRILHAVGEGFDFVHDRIREVARTQLLLPRRRLLHARVAEALEKLYATNLGPHAATLGQHYREAQVWAKAVGYCTQAGAQAMARSACREAVAWYEHALGAIRHLPETADIVARRIDLHFDVRNALIQTGHLADVVDRLREAAALSHTLGDRKRLGRALDYLSNNLLSAGELTEAVTSAERAEAIALELGDFGLGVAARFHLGGAYHALGQYRHAADLLTNIVTSLGGDAELERYGLAVPPSVLGRVWLAWCLAEVGRFAEGRRYAEEALRLAEASTRRLDLSYAYRAIGFVRLGQGLLDEAIPPLEHGLVLSESADLAVSVPYYASGLGYAFLLAGRVTEALPLLERASTRARDHRLLPNCLVWLALAYLIAGRREEAAAAANEALGRARACRQQGDEAYALWGLGEIAATHQSFETPSAETRYRESLTLAGVLGMRPLVAHCHLGLGKLYRRTGRGEMAHEHLTIATTMYREMDMRFWLEQVEVSGL
jgi:DNA-binding SARP family transcriptional activator/tetratricopeptide (TPR) repeat protein